MLAAWSLGFRSMSAQIPEKPALEGLEEKWRRRWETDGTYRFDRNHSRDEVFSIDTPPPTVSGRLHIGHVFSYTHTDLVARYQRMAGKEVFYPIGWDDNGLNVERRVQLMTGTIVDPTLPYVADFVAPQEIPKRPLAVSRPNFIELCQQIVPQMEAEYHDLWARLGLSIDWSFTYTTIGPRATKVSQGAFLRLLADGVAYRAEAPTLWDVDLRTAVAQAELEDREIPGSISASYSRVPTAPIFSSTPPDRSCFRPASPSSPILRTRAIATSSDNREPHLCLGFRSRSSPIVSAIPRRGPVSP